MNVHFLIIILFIFLGLGQAQARVDCERFTDDTVEGIIIQTNVWRDAEGKPTTFLYKIRQTKGKCNVSHVEGPNNTRCREGAVLSASGWASFGQFGAKEHDIANMLHTKKIVCKPRS